MRDSDSKKRAIRALYAAYVTVRDLLRRAYLLPVRLYRHVLSPLKPVPTCRFTPSCSRYAIDAVTEWGIVVGTLLTLWRLVRCNPFSAGGEDPVPKKNEVLSKLRSWKNDRAS